VSHSQPSAALIHCWLQTAGGCLFNRADNAPTGSTAVKLRLLPSNLPPNRCTANRLLAYILAVCVGLVFTVTANAVTFSALTLMVGSQ